MKQEALQEIARGCAEIIDMEEIEKLVKKHQVRYSIWSKISSSSSWENVLIFINAWKKYYNL